MPALSHAPVVKPFRVGVLATIQAADAVVERLLSAGFTEAEITVICSDDAKERHFREFEHERPAGANTPLAATVGGTIGAALGGLTAIAAGAATGGVGLLVAGGAGVWTGGVFGGFLGAMLSRGTEKEPANYYNQALLAGQILVAVEVHGDNAEPRLKTAEQILAAAGSHPISLVEG